MSLIIDPISAQEYGRGFIYNGPEQEEKVKVFEVDTTLFRVPITHSTDFSSGAIHYYHTPVSTRRRGLYYTTAEQIIAPTTQYIKTLSQPVQQSSVTLYGAQSNYRVGLRATHSQMIQSKWSLYASLWSQYGRDHFVEGVFRNTLSPEVTLSRQFDNNHFISINASLYYSMQGLQYSSTSEAYSLIGSNYYNPSWGLYNGKVRNSRVRRDLNPSISLHDQRKIGDQTTLTIEANASYSRRANSSLGWYNASTPMPDYYRNMPSFFTNSEVNSYLTNIWRTGDQDYTQINWEKIETINSISSDGNAYYTLEDRVERKIRGEFIVIARSDLDRLTLSYGFKSQWQSNRNFKVMRDLLGADYFTDYDVFMGDSYNSTTPLQNDLANPDRKIFEGDRFGYDYAIRRTCSDAIFRAQYRAQRLDFNLETTISSESYVRYGYYEKERFSGSASLGESQTIALSPYTIRFNIGYAHQANQYYSLKFISTQLSPLESNLFLNAATANYLALSSGTEMINSAAFAFRINGYTTSLTGEIYALRSRNGSSIYSLYDDLSSTMCRASITEIGYSSYGVELTADFNLHHDLRLSATLAAGRYFYDTNPYIELLDDYDFSTVSDKTTSQMSGINIGNTPQLIATTSATYFGISKYILTASASLAALRYEQPSIARRSQRVLSQAFISDESTAAALSQQSLGSVFDVELAASRYFHIENGGQLSVRLAVSNLLGQLSRVTYAKESDRVLLQDVDGYFSGSTLREGTLQYGAPRTINFSIGYKF